MNKYFYPQRIILYYTIDPCKSLNKVKYIVLNSLIVSYGIRVDTELLVVDQGSGLVFHFNGYDQKYLHAQDRSLERYLEKIFCTRKTYPGIRIVGEHSVLLKSFLDDTDLFFVWEKSSRKNMFSYNLLPLINTRKVLLTNKELSNYSHKHVRIYCKSYITAITSLHHIIDVIYGSWIRRKGRITWIEREKAWFN